MNTKHTMAILIALVLTALFIFKAVAADPYSHDYDDEHSTTHHHENDDHGKNGDDPDHDDDHTHKEKKSKNTNEDTDQNDDSSEYPETSQTESTFIGGYYTTYCMPKYECFDWRECNGETQKRVCYKTNNCESNEWKPREIRSCEAKTISTSAEQNEMQTNLAEIKDTLPQTKESNSKITANSVWYKNMSRENRLTSLAIFLLTLLGIYTQKKYSKLTLA